LVVVLELQDTLQMASAAALAAAAAAAHQEHALEELAQLVRALQAEIVLEMLAVLEVEDLHP
jgi:hypothetical protein